MLNRICPKREQDVTEYMKVELANEVDVIKRPMGQDREKAMELLQSLPILIFQDATKPSRTHTHTHEEAAP